MSVSSRQFFFFFFAGENLQKKKKAEKVPQPPRVRRPCAGGLGWWHDCLKTTDMEVRLVVPLWNIPQTILSECIMSLWPLSQAFRELTSDWIFCWDVENGRPDLLVQVSSATQFVGQDMLDVTALRKRSTTAAEPHRSPNSPKLYYSLWYACTSSNQGTDLTSHCCEMMHGRLD